MAKSRKVIRTKSIYSKKNNNKKILSTIFFIVLLVVFVGLGVLVAMAMGLGRGESTASSSSAANISSQLASSQLPASSESVASSDIAKPEETGDINAHSLSISDMQKDKASLVTLFKSYKEAGYSHVSVILKNQDGTVNYDTKNSYVTKYKAAAEKTAKLADITAAAEEAGIKLVARISTLQDPLVAHVRNDNSFAVSGGTTTNWLDGANGKPWLNPYMAEARKYICSIVTDASNAGFDVIALENVNFPLKNGQMNSIVTSPSHADILKQLVSEAKTAANGKTVVNVINPETLFTSVDYRNMSITDIAAGIDKENVYINISDSYITKNLEDVAKRTGVSYDKAKTAETKSAVYKAIADAFTADGAKPGMMITASDKKSIESVISANGIVSFIEK